MSFHSGRVTFCRFFAEGDGPTMADDTTLATLAEHGFRETDIGAPEAVESGWTTGEHLFDTQFTYAKNGFGNALLFALRIDTHQVPAEVKQAYKRMNEAAAAQENPSGFASKRQKREAGETAARQLHEDLAAGKFRRSKTVPVLWDLKRKMVYFGAAGNTAIEQLCLRFRESFNIELQPVTSGSLAGHLLRAMGKSRDYEDLHPSAFTAAPPEARGDADDAGPQRDAAIPFVPWVANSIDTKDFVGNEMLIWIWSAFENDEGIVTIDTETGRDDVAVVIDKALDMDCAWGVRGKQTLRGDGPTRLPEAGEALALGKWPRKASLIVADPASQHQWELTLQGDRWIISSAALPQVDDAASGREVIDQRLEMTRRLADTLDAMFAAFLKQRTSSAWPAARTRIRRWITDRRTTKAATEPAAVAAGVE
jgi:hypothetical protein